MAGGQRKAEVTVLGAGVFGLSIAWACQCRGAQVRVIDPGGVGAGSSGGIVGALAPHVPENWNDKKAFQLESLLMAEAFWAEVESASDISPGYARSGRVQPVLDAKALDLAYQRADTARTLWLGQAVWQVTQDPPGPLRAVTPTGYYIHDTLSGRIHPRRACESLALAIKAKGGEVVREGQQTGMVVHATGTTGLSELSAHLGKPVGNGVKGQAALLDFAMPDAPQLFVDGLHIVPHSDGTTAIGSTSERNYDQAETTDEQLDAIIEKARAVLPELEKARVLERWAAARPRSKSRAPMLGPHPIYKDAFIANGGFKIGFGMAPKIGHVMADLVLEGRDTVPEPFKPDASL